MEMRIVATAVVAVAWWVYRCGKRDGSQKGYGAGRRDARRRRRQ